MFQFAAFAPNPPDSTTPDGATPFVIGHLSDNELPWKVALAWHTSENVTLYALRANGFRLGGTNNRGVCRTIDFEVEDDCSMCQLPKRLVTACGILKKQGRHHTAVIYHTRTVCKSQMRCPGNDPGGLLSASYSRC